MDIVHTVPPHYYFPSSSSLAARNYFPFPVKLTDWPKRENEKKRKKVQSNRQVPYFSLFSSLVRSTLWSLLVLSRENCNLHLGGINRVCTLSYFCLQFPSVFSIDMCAPISSVAAIQPTMIGWHFREREGKRELSPVANLVLIYCRLKVCIKCVPPFSSLSKG